MTEKTAAFQVRSSGYGRAGFVVIRKRPWHGTPLEGYGSMPMQPVGCIQCWSTAAMLLVTTPSWHSGGPTPTVCDRLCVRGAPWSAAYRLHGQLTGAFLWRPVWRSSQKTDQFRLNPTQNCAPARRCNRVSSVNHLALGKCSGITRHATIPMGFSRMRTIHHPHPAHIQPTIAMTN